MKYSLSLVLLILTFWVQPMDSMATTAVASQPKKCNTSHFAQHTVQKKSSIWRSFKGRLAQKIWKRKLMKKMKSPSNFMQVRIGWMFWVRLGLVILLQLLVWILILGPLFNNIS